MLKKLAVIFYFVFQLIEISVGQDIHLSQFYAADHLLNPARVGDHDGQYRIASNYRNQWRQFGDPITTSLLSADYTYNYYSHAITGGVFFAHDEFSGFNQTTNKILLSAAYIYTYKKNNFRVGIQPGIVLRNTDLSKQTFPNQWNYPQGSFDQSISNQENNMQESIRHFDLNLGVSWSRNFNKFSTNIGMALNHINRPKNTYFVEYTERLRTKKIIHGELDFYINRVLTLSPKILFMSTTNTNQTLIGSNFSYKLPSEKFKEVFIGMFYRHGVNRNVDAYYPVFGFTFNQFDFGVSYDFNISGLSANGSKSTFELSVIYTAPNFKPKFKTLPCERY
jgi:type IX secretion system PorP/SprF family membrane protein